MAHEEHSHHHESSSGDIISKYDRRSCMQTVSTLFTKVLLEYDGKSIEQDFHGQEDSGKLSTKLIKPGMKLLDFACGTGLVASKLAPYLSKDTEVVGIDISAASLKGFDNKLNSTDINSRSYSYNILDETLAPELAQFVGYFDLVVCTLAYHHMHNYHEVTQKLASFLKKGGSMVIIDFFKKDHGGEAHTKVAGSHHLRALTLGELNYTLETDAGLTGVNSFTAFKTNLWVPSQMIKNHSPQDIVDKLEAGILEKKVEGEMDVYLIEMQFSMAVGKKV